MAVNVEKVTTLLFIALAAGYMFVAKDYAPGARLIPMIVGGATIAIALVQLIGPRVRIFKALVEEKGTDEERDAVKLLLDKQTLKRTGVIVFWTALLYALIYVVGFVVAIPIFIAAFLSLVDRRSWLLTGVMTLCLGSLSYLLLVVLVGLPWNEGVLWTLIK